MTTAQPTLLNTSQMTSTRTMRALHRERRQAELDKMRKPAPAKPRPDFVETEMGLKGESRVYDLFAIRCHQCDFKGGSVMEVNYDDGPMQPRYRVRCTCPDCNNATPWLPSSQAAIQLWKVTAALSR